jgi:predicted small metal-binding protein
MLRSRMSTLGVHYTKEAQMKVVHCPCGKDVEAESDDELVMAVHDHMDADHPDMEKYSKEQILGMAHEH